MRLLHNLITKIRNAKNKRRSQRREKYSSRLTELILGKMDTELNIKHLKDLDDYFVKMEGLTYKELYTIYNLGDPFIEVPVYLGIPPEIQRKILPTVSLQEFLTQNSYWERFLKNFTSPVNKERLASFGIKNVTEFCVECPPEDWIKGAFIWDITSEWANLDHAWDELISKKFKSKIIPLFYEE